MEQSFQGRFVYQGTQDILIVAIGTKDHPSRVRTAGFGVGVRQYFRSTPLFYLISESKLKGRDSLIER